jgi:hypothetical protein
MSMPNSPISFHGNAVPDGIMAGSRKRKQTFSMNDPDNGELERLATQAAKKKAKLSKANSSEKETTNPKKKGPKNRQPSVEEEVNIFPPLPARFPRNPRNIIESSDDDSDNEAATRPTTEAKKNLKKCTLSQNKETNQKINKKLVPKLEQNRQPSVEDVDDENGSSGDDDMVEIVEKPAESAEEELSQ